MKREAELQLQKQRFGEKKQINRIKKGNIDKKGKFKDFKKQKL